MLDLKFTRPDGTPARLTVSTGPIFGASKGFDGHICVALDTTKQATIEDQLRQAQKMETLGQLTGGMAHDFNNLLGVIIGNLDLLAEELESDKAKSAMVEACVGAALRGSDLTRSLLAFSRRQQLRLETVSIKMVLDRLLGMLKRTLGETVAVRVATKNDLWPVTVDTALLENAVLNICINARDAMPEGGTISIETANTHFDEAYAAQHVEVTPGDYTMLAISDTGCGMSQEVLPHIFEPFFTTKREGKGTGLGLAMVYGFVKQSGGHVSAYSEVGVGTTLKIYLPRADGAGGEGRRKAEKDAVSGKPIRGATVLVVEDKEDMRKVVVRQVASLGHRVIEAGDAHQALDILAGDRSIDLLFTDVVMPGGMDGVALAGKAREILPGLKVLFTSGFPDLAMAQKFDASRDMLLSKPYRKQDLARKIQEILDKRG